jgi:hypothetical protein
VEGARAFGLSGRVWGVCGQYMHVGRACILGEEYEGRMCAVCGEECVAACSSLRAVCGQYVSREALRLAPKYVR